MEDKIRQLLIIIKDNGKCPYCGNYYDDNGICLYCGNKKLDMVSIYRTLKESIKLLPKDYLNPIYQDLYHYRKIPFIGNIFANQEFLTYLKTIVHQINQKVVNFQKLDVQELTDFRFLLKEVPVFLSDDAINYAIRSVLIKNEEFSLADFEKLLTIFLRRLMNKYVEDPIVKIKSKEEMRLGDMACLGLFSYQDQSISINNELIKKCFEKPSYSLFITLFHELTHLEQFSRQRKGKKISPVDSQEIKEQILKDISPTFYHENYDTLVFESEADANALNMALVYFETIHLQLPSNIKSNLLNMYKLNLNNLFKRKYLYQGETRSIEEIFSQVILNEDMRPFLKAYPQLDFEIVKAEDGYRLKSINEMIDDYQKMKSNNHNPYDERIIKEFYSNKVASLFDLGLNANFGFHNHKQ
jgi:hypothetical protein